MATTAKHAATKEQVLVEKNGPVTTVILNRPEVRNCVDTPTGRKLVEQAHQVCPYSNATRGNIPVELVVE